MPRTLVSSSFAGSHLTVTLRSLPVTARMPSRFFSCSANGSKSSIVPSGFANVNSLDTPAALETTVVPERALHRVQSVDAWTGRQARHGRDLLAASETRRPDGARVHRLPIHEHRTRASLRTVATEVAVRETELEIHRLPEALAVVDDRSVGRTVDVE